MKIQKFSVLSFILFFFRFIDNYTLRLKCFQKLKKKMLSEIKKEEIFAE